MTDLEKSEINYIVGQLAAIAYIAESVHHDEALKTLTLELAKRVERLLND
jgi:hypothetical protein